MSPGALRHILVHQRPADIADGAGGVARSFVTVGRLWGTIEDGGASFGIGEERPRGVLSASITVRAPHAVAVGDRLVLGARIFHVETVSDPEGRGRFSRCRCREEQP